MRAEGEYGQLWGVQQGSLLGTWASADSYCSCHHGHRAMGFQVRQALQPCPQGAVTVTQLQQQVDVQNMMQEQG